MAAILLVLFAIAWRVALASGSHAAHAWWNFTAVGGSLLFFGARRPLRQMWIPVVALAITDLCITRFAYGLPFVANEYLISWAWYAAVVVMGAWLLKQHASAGRIVSASVLSATSFFIVSNFAVWAGSTMYDKTATGLVTCMAAGLPFYRNDLVSTLLVTGAAFSVLALVRRNSDHHETETEKIVAA
jgi:hypothetical protein